MDRRTQLTILVATMAVTVASMEFGAWIQRQAYRKFQEGAIGTYRCGECEQLAIGTYTEIYQ